MGDPRDAFDVIARVLVPYLGDAMARAALHVNRQKLGLLGPKLSDAELERLLEALTPGLHVFVGHEVTARLLGEVREALRGGGT
jgi:hypothetical protein